MDKYELVLDIIEHPGKYSPQDLQVILSDPETREIYTVLCQTESALKAERPADVEAEWKAFSRTRLKQSRRAFRFFGSRAASVAVIVCTSLFAIAAGIILTVNIAERRPDSVAAKHELHPSASAVAGRDSIVEKTDTVKKSSLPVMFENETLETIMKAVAERYGVKVKFADREAASLHLYYKFDPELTLDEMISQLNTFEQINIRRTGENLIID